MLADPAALDSLRRIVRRLRRADHDNTRQDGPSRDAVLSRLFLGEPVKSATVHRALPADVISSLSRSVLEEHSGNFASRLVLFFAGPVAVALPAVEGDEAEIVYIEADSLWLLRLVWEHAPAGGRAAELGVGTGMLTAALGTRYEAVVGTELLPRTAACAQLTVELNRLRGRSADVVITDVGACLRPGSFDLVAANPPWSPAYPHTDQRRKAVFADGGPTGTELPGRFLEHAVELLAPGGVAVVLNVDLSFKNGDRPLQDQLTRIDRSDLTLDVVSGEDLPWHSDFVEMAHSRLANMTTARNVAVVARRAS